MGLLCLIVACIVMTKNRQYLMQIRIAEISETVRFLW